jgi:branched-chain amino acid transport system ATP-binding protein
MKAHTTVLLVEQNFAMASRLADEFYLIDDGAHGAPRRHGRARPDHDLKKKYLGL